jgi:hypothetical protein
MDTSKMNEGSIPETVLNMKVKGKHPGGRQDQGGTAG